MAIFDHVLVPVASEADAVATCESLGPYLDEIERVTGREIRTEVRYVRVASA
jgi:hypothetical protein